MHDAPQHRLERAAHSFKIIPFHADLAARLWGSFSATPIGLSKGRISDLEYF
jgi:hypothetical protein